MLHRCVSRHLREEPRCVITSEAVPHIFSVAPVKDGTRLLERPSVRAEVLQVARADAFLRGTRSETRMSYYSARRGRIRNSLAERLNGPDAHSCVLHAYHIDAPCAAAAMYPCSTGRNAAARYFN